MQSEKKVFYKFLVYSKIVLFATFSNTTSGYAMNQETGSIDNTFSRPINIDNQMKICYFRTEELYKKLKQMKEIENKLEALETKLEVRVENRRKQIIKWQQKWESKGPLLSSEQIKYNEEAIKIQQEFEKLLILNETELENKEKVLMKNLTKKIELAAETYAIENGFDFVLSYESGGIYYGSKNYNITDNLVKIMNDKYKY